MDLSVLEKRIGIAFKNEDLLLRAVTHRSYLNEHRRENLKHNEQLEFLGDAVLELVVTNYLVNNFSDKNEGELTLMRTSVVCGDTAYKVSESIGLSEFLLLSKGEARDDNSRAKKLILANAFEALVGAVYLDQGYSVAEKFVNNLLISKIEGNVRNLKDSKSELMEKVQAAMGQTPTYRTLEETGPDHNKHFVAGVYVGENLLAKGQGKSKKEAEKDAATNGLRSFQD